METRNILNQLAERARKYAINLDGRIERDTTVCTRGGNAAVYRGTLSPNGTTVAIKTVLGVTPADTERIKRALKEAHVWSKSNHPNVLPLLGITTDFDLTVSLVTTWMERGSAHSYVQNRHNDPRPLIRDIAEGLRYLHNLPKGPIIHGDLKGASPSENVLIAEDGRALLTDFGLSIHFNSSFTMTVKSPCGGSLYWMAPELVEAMGELNATIQSDIWAFGMTALELFTGKVPYHRLKTVTALLFGILEGPPERPSDEDSNSRMTDEWWTLCSCCWTREPSSRISMSDSVKLIGKLLAPPQDIIIAVMGPTGSGKSNFINKLTDSEEESGADKLKSCTKDIREFRVSLGGGEHYVFVDTPGFDDTYRSDRDILQTIADWLEKKYRGNVKLTGVIYTHRISNNRMSGSVCKNLDLFSQLCGDKAAQCVRLVTTMWDNQNPENTESWQNRVSHLEGNFWKPLISLGARHERFFNTQQSAWNVINGLVQARTPLVRGDSTDVTRELNEASAGNTLLIQEEMVDAEKKLNETSAGRALYSQLKKVLLEQKEMLKELGDALAEKNPNAVAQLRAEYDRTEAEIQKVIKDMESMKIPLGRRIALFFGGKKTHSRKIELNLNWED
ncbi:kinase-like domain-containing protein [Pisolithus marmoratus]|nr:kinase-like domain-containing protein [Pisolithus marmoratus]